MFTGIVQGTSRIVAVSKRGGVLCVRVEKPRAWKLAHGGSVAIDGICSTVVARGARWFEVEYMPETLSKTIAASLVRGSIVNLERPLRAGNPINGHLLHGHVDARGTVLRVQDEGSSRIVSVRAPRTLSPLIARGGSIAIDGVALAVARKREHVFSVALIPYTLTHTTLARLAPGTEVNLEADFIARTLLVGTRTGGKVRSNAAKRVRKKTRRA